MTSLSLSWDAQCDPLPIVPRLWRVVLDFLLKPRALACEPAPGETACACDPPAQLLRRNASPRREGEERAIEGWISFPIAVADGTATGTVFLEVSPEAGVRARVVANVSVERGSYQNWIHFRLPIVQELEIEEIYGLRATLVATEVRTGQKRLFGTPRAVAIERRPTDAGIMLELEEWG